MPPPGELLSRPPPDGLPVVLGHPAPPPLPPLPPPLPPPPPPFPPPLPPLLMFNSNSFKTPKNMRPHSAGAKSNDAISGEGDCLSDATEVRLERQGVAGSAERMYLAGNALSELCTESAHISGLADEGKEGPSNRKARGSPPDFGHGSRRSHWRNARLHQALPA